MWLAKATFVLVFEHTVSLVQAFIQYVIPDVPEEVELHAARVRYVHRQHQQQQAVAANTMNVSAAKSCSGNRRSR